MTYRDRERERVEKHRDRIFDDPGGGLYRNLPRKFVLSEPGKNLWSDIRAEAIDYFDVNDISWWSGKKKEPTGHLLSSQVACINHLFPMRQRQDLVTMILKSIDPEVTSAVSIDGGYVAFEFIGKERYLQERGFTRGANCTSVDAAMIGEKPGGVRCLYLIEWKYTELYAVEDKCIDVRSAVYDHHITSSDSPFVQDVPPQAYYFEPFYQLMRQTLLGWLLARNRDHDCSQYRHIHVVPEQNLDILEKITSPLLRSRGNTLSDVWRSVLVNPGQFISTTPEKLLAPIVGADGTATYISYLKERYW